MFIVFRFLLRITAPSILASSKRRGAVKSHAILNPPDIIPFSSWRSPATISAPEPTWRILLNASLSSVPGATFSSTLMSRSFISFSVFSPMETPNKENRATCV